MQLPGPLVTTGRILRLTVIILVVLGWIPLLGLTGARLLGGGTTPLAQLAPFAPVAAVGWLLAVLLLAVLRAWGLALFAGLLLALHLFWLAPPVVERLQADPVPDGTPLRVLTLNAQYGGADVDQVARLVVRRGIDLVAVEELTPEFAARFDLATRRLLPHHVLHAEPGSPAGTGIWARYPLTSKGLLASQFHMPKVEMSVPGAGNVEVIGVHTLSPTPDKVVGWRRDLALLARQARDASEPTIMLGDFNATRDHAPFRKVLSGSLIDTADVALLMPWTGQTWPADRLHSPPAVRIDHLLVSRDDFGVIRARTAQIGGTDHRAVIAELVIRSSAGLDDTPAPSPSSTGITTDT